MKIQVLVATMGQTDRSLVEKMNLRTDAIVGNQCDRNSVEEFYVGENRFVYLNFAERGVGLNRNNALMRADADVCLFADDDMVYDDDYVETIERAFAAHPDADVLVFNLREKNSARKMNLKTKRVNYFNYLRYGMVRVAVRLSAVKKRGIYFNQCFGGGTEHCHGEDTLFLNACLKNGLKIIATPDYIATLLDDRPSTWNTGYDDKYLRDQGVLYRTLSRKWWRLLCLQDAFRRRKSYGRSFWRAYSAMVDGAKNF